MIVDFILDRQDGVKYNAREFYDYVREEESIFDFNTSISYAMDELEEEDVKKCLCDYIKDNGYNLAICDYINSVEWIGGC